MWVWEWGCLKWGESGEYQQQIKYLQWMGTSEVMGWETPLIMRGQRVQSFSVCIVFHCWSGLFQPLHLVTRPIVRETAARWQGRRQVRKIKYTKVSAHNFDDSFNKSFYKHEILSHIHPIPKYVRDTNKMFSHSWSGYVWCLLYLVTMSMGLVRNLWLVLSRCQRAEYQGLVSV